MRTIEAALAGPAIVLVVATAGALMMTAAGSPSYWRSVDLTLAEAALLRDDGEVVRLIGLGQDPNARHAVRRGLIDNATHEMTPLAAAIRIRRPVMVRLLLLHGAAPDDDARSLVPCEPAAGELGEIQALLRGSALPAECPAPAPAS